jgi:pilus assembly protein Flp/PilA
MEMLKLITKAQSLTTREDGATAVEYALLVALIAVAIIAAVTALGGGLNNLFTSVKSSLHI